MVPGGAMRPAVDAETGLPETTVTVSPYGRDDWEQAMAGVARGARVVADPDRIATGQETVCVNFGDGTPVSELVDGLVSGRVDPRLVPPVGIYFCAGRIFTADHRRLYAFRIARQLLERQGGGRLHIPVRVLNESDTEYAKQTKNDHLTRPAAVPADPGQSIRMLFDLEQKAQRRQELRRRRQELRHRRR